MKPSGIEWIGDIPDDWEVTKIGQLYLERNEKVSDREYEALSVTKHGILKQLESAAKTDNGDNRKLVKSGDFVINSRSDRRGSCGISKFDGSVSLINIILMPTQKIANGYYNYLFRTENFADEFYKYGNGIVDDLWSTKWTSMKKILVPFPSLRTQQRIADYLDEKCGEIDATIAKQKESIEKLKAYKQSLISETVTKGLDKSAPHKPSGIEWIGYIPDDWEVRKLLSIFKEHKDRNKNLEEQNLLSLSYGKIKRKDINNNDGLLPASFETYNIVENGDIVFRLTDLQNDKRSLRTGIVTQRGIITSAYVTIRPKIRLDSRFFHYLYHMYDICKVFYGMGDGVRQGMGFEDLKNIPTLIPPLKTQQKIADYLDSKCSQIDKYITEKQNIIQKLDAYKKSLIFECVTGKQKM